MKKTFNIIVLAMLFSVTSCTWTIPEKISVSTKASFGFNMGNVEKEFDEYFNTDSFASLPTDSNITMYDYFPGKQNEKIKKFLVQVPIQEIPIDFTSYFNDMKLASMIRGLSFDKTIEIPEISLDFNTEIPGSVINAGYIIDPTNVSATVPTINITNAVDCKIETGKLTMEIELPSSWTGVTVSYTPSLSGNATLANPTPSTDGNKRIFTLDGAVFTKGDIKIDCTVTFNGLSPSTDFTKNVQVKVYSSITKIEEISVDLDVDEVKISKQQSISDEFKKAITRIQFGNSGLKGTYINTLPAGNDITIVTSSSFIGMSSKSATLVSNTSTKTNITGLNNDQNGYDYLIDLTTNPDPKIDFDVDIQLPNSTPGSKTMKLKDVEPNKNYQLKIDLEPDINWNEVEINSSKASSAGIVDTGLNIGQVFGSITSSLGGDFSSKCSIKSVPIYIFASKPNLSSLDNAKFKGSLKMFFSNNDGVTDLYPDDSIDFMPSPDGGITEGEMPFADHPVLTMEGTTKKEVITDISKLPSSSHNDISGLISKTKDEATGSIFMDYNIQMETGNSGSLKITKTDFDNSASSSPSIQIIAYVVVPLEFIASDNVDIDIIGMMGNTPGQDLLDRDSAPDNSDKEKYYNAVREVRVKYKADVIPFYCMPENQNLYKNSTIYIDWDGSGSIYSERYLNMEKDEIVVEDFQDILNIYPLTPDVRLRIPKGSFSIPRNAKMDLSIKLCVETDPDYKIFVMGEE